MMIINTAQLSIRLLSPEDAPFIVTLLNSPGWLRYIGDRQVHGEPEALAYIRRINKNPDVTYWTVLHTATGTPAGLVTLLRRDYLDTPDIGFAFLPDFSGKGYAYEATKAVLCHLVPQYAFLYAITRPDNRASIKLLGKLGLRFERNLQPDKELLHLYRASKTDVLSAIRPDPVNT